MQFGIGLLPHIEIKRKTARPSEILENPQTIGEHVRRERKIRGLRQVDVAKALDLDPHTICDWERGNKTIKFPKHYPRIFAWPGYDPFPTPSSRGEHLLQSRLRMGLTSQEMADRWGIDQGTLLRRETDQV